MNAPSTSPPAEQPSSTNWMALLKLAVITLIIVFIVRAVQDARADFAAANISLATIDYRWLLLASAGYLLGMLPMALNWHRLLVAMQQQVPVTAAVRAHYVSQLGKYVPGKACVVAIRLALLRPFRLQIATTIVSMMAEVLAMMSVGAVIGSIVIALQFRGRPEITLVATVLALGAGLPVIPPVLRYALRFLERRRAKKEGVEPGNAASQLTWAVVVPGWIGIVPGWICLGVSMFAAMKALNVPTTQAMTWWELPWITASYAISVVVGFASMLPGGLFVREWAMNELITPTYGPVVGLVAPVVHRMVILVSELLLCGILYLTPRAGQRPSPASPVP